MHLIVASRDLPTFHHVHPAMDHEGRWTVDLPELAPGAHRAFADFRASGAGPVILGVDVTVPGRTTVPPQLSTVTTHTDSPPSPIDDDH